MDSTTRGLRAVLAAGDCASVLLDTEPNGATLRLSARDGRLAVRQLQQPDDLVPALQALTVEGPEPAPAPAAPEVAPAPAPPLMPATAANDGDSVHRAPFDPYRLRPFLSAALGFRLGADWLISPTLGGSISIVSGRLELGLLARYEAHYVHSTGGNQQQPDTSGFAFGAQVGAHRPLDNWALRGGLTFLLAALHEDRGSKNGRAEGRLGLYGGAVWPARNRLRFRADLAAELVPYSIGSSETNALGSTSLPWWGFSLALGVEYG